MTTTNIASPVRITCACKVCNVNAAALGRKLPLAAEVPAMPGLLAMTKTAKGRHGLVHIAHDPNGVTGAAARARTGITAA